MSPFPHMIYSLAVALDAIEPIIADLGRKAEVQVKDVLEHLLFDPIELKDKVGPAERKRWFHSIGTQLVAVCNDAESFQSIVRSNIAFEKLNFLLQNIIKSEPIDREKLMRFQVRRTMPVWYCHLTLFAHSKGSVNSCTSRVSSQFQ
jgi:hypothetical protein